jgi:hypothetical protein
MRKIQIQQNQRFGRLVIIKEIPQSKKHRRFQCICDCGATREVHLNALLSGMSKSCGCLRDEIVTIHGMHKSPEYKTWSHMISRCTNQKSNCWHNYGGRGIKVCDRWLHSFEAFLEDVGPKPGKAYSIDRYPDNNGNYEPGNVRWATMMQQHGNTRKNIHIDYRGEVRLLADVAKELGVNVETIRCRRRRGWADSELFRNIQVHKPRAHSEGL